MKPAAAIVQELKVLHHWQNVFVPFPPSANFEVTKHLARYVGFKCLFNACAEALFRTAKFGGPWRNIDEAKRLQVAEESLVRGEIRDKTPQASRAGIHITECDHGRGTKKGAARKSGNLSKK